jgi:predicted molibdopterin-dependent oxidoreductase YjgC
MADVVLPGVSFAEKAGTFTNTERRVQLVRPAITPPGDARQDWSILQDVANGLGAAWRYSSPSDIFNEMRGVTPSYAGMDYGRLKGDGLQWPCPTADHPGTPILHAQSFTRGLGLFAPVEYRPPAEEPDAAYPFLLSTGRSLFHWHGGTLSRRSPGLDWLAPEGEIEIHPHDAAALGIARGEVIQVRSRRGMVRARARLTRRSPPGTVFMTFHYAEAAANLLTSDAVDPVAKIPEYKVAAVRLEKVAEAVQA